MNKASKGGLIYGDYLQVSARIWFLLPWSLWRFEPGLVIDASPCCALTAVRQSPRQVSKCPFPAWVPRYTCSTSAWLSRDGCRQTVGWLLKLQGSWVFRGVNRKLLVLANLGCEVVQLKRLSLAWQLPVGNFSTCQQAMCNFPDYYVKAQNIWLEKYIAVLLGAIQKTIKQTNKQKSLKVIKKYAKIKWHK